MARDKTALSSVNGVAEVRSEAGPDRSEELVRLMKLNERREPLVVQVATWIGLGVIEGRLRPGQDLMHAMAELMGQGHHVPRLAVVVNQQIWMHTRHRRMRERPAGLARLQPRVDPRVVETITARSILDGTPPTAA